jgi:glycosyltransferase involved in cell wall biosynthesis
MAIAGNPQELARAEREVGLRSWSIVFERPYYDYPCDEVLCEDGYNPLSLEFKRWALLRRAIRDFDIIHFNFGRTIMPQRVFPDQVSRRGFPPWLGRIYNLYAQLLELGDLPLLKKLGKGIVMTFQGDDARQGDFCRRHCRISPANEVEPGYYSSESDAHKRSRIARISRYADRIFALNPDLLHVLPAQAQFLPYSHIDLRDWRPGGSEGHPSDTTVIIHAPSHRGVKGTRYILETISRLQSEGIGLEFLLVEGLSHAEARAVYERADLLLDQLLCGWYGGLAVELMALGKPVMCYIREEDLQFIPPQMGEEIPIIQVSPATLHQVLREWLIQRRNELRELGGRSRAYVEKWHDPKRIASRMKAEYEGIMASKSRKVNH